MNKLRIIAIFLVLLLPAASGYADEVLWKSGANLYIKLDKQDKYKDGSYIPNQHPVSLNPQEIRDSLNSILVWNKSFFTGALKDDDEAESVFSLEQARLLGSYIAAGLAKARPDQDIHFAVTRRKKSFLIMKDTTYTSGRAFYLDGKLHVILGEYDKLGDKFKERAYQGSGSTSEIRYYFKPGKRAKKSGFKKAIILSDGLDTYKDNGKTRKDWFVIDIKKASAAYAALQAGEELQNATTVVDERLRQEQERSARERREMRLEMARLRKEMKQQSSGQNVERTIEERLEQLEGLKQKGFISEEEYSEKRKEILGDI